MLVRLPVFSFQVRQNANWTSREAVSLVNYAKLEKEYVILGVSNRIEIWSKHQWKDYFTSSEESFADIAESMVGFDV